MANQGEIIEKKVVDTGDIGRPSKAIEVTYQPLTPAPVIIKYTEEQLKQLISQNATFTAGLQRQIDNFAADTQKYQTLLTELIA